METEKRQDRTREVDHTVGLYDGNCEITGWDTNKKLNQEELLGSFGESVNKSNFADL